MQKDKIDKIYHLAPNGKTSWYKFALMILGALKTKYPSQMNKKYFRSYLISRET